MQIYMKILNLTQADVIYHAGKVILPAGKMELPAGKMAFTKRIYRKI